MPDMDEDNLDAGSGIHGMSLLVGKLISQVSHVNNNLKMISESAERQREKLHEKVDKLGNVIFGVKADLSRVDTKVDDVRQDVAEMKNAMQVAEVTLDDYRQSKPTATEAIGGLKTSVKELQEVVRGFELANQGDKVWWDWMAKIGFLGWTAICGLGAGLIGLLFYWLQKFV